MSRVHLTAATHRMLRRLAWLAVLTMPFVVAACGKGGGTGY
jgi:hypothetical protein